MTAPAPHRRVGRRAGSLLLAAIQLLVFACVPVADAVLDSDSMGLGLHIEAQGSEHCSTHHDHLFCQVFRSFSAVLGSDANPDIYLIEPAPITDAAPVVAYRPVTSPEDFGPLGSRAPPLI